MAFDGWQNRFWAAVDKDGRSLRAISLAAEVGPNYLQQLRKRNNSPTLDNAMRICDELGVSFLNVLTNLEIDVDGQELLEIAAQLSPSRRRALIEAFRPEEAVAQPKEPTDAHRG